MLTETFYDFSCSFPGAYGKRHFLNKFLLKPFFKMQRLLDYSHYKKSPANVANDHEYSVDCWTVMPYQTKFHSYFIVSVVILDDSRNANP